MQKVSVGLIIVVVILALASTSFGQSPQTGNRPAMPSQPDRAIPPTDTAPSPAGAMTQQLTQMLNLSEAQAAKVKSVLEEEHGKMLALRDDPTLSTDDKEAKFLVIRRDASEQIMTILSPEQQKKLVEFLQGAQRQDNQQPDTQAAPPQF